MCLKFLVKLKILNLNEYKKMIIDEMENIMCDIIFVKEEF